MPLHARYLFTGAVFALLGVALGAFGAHALRESLPGGLDIWRTAVLYQLIHAVVLLVVGVWFRVGKLHSHLPLFAFTFGIFCFSGSLYALVLGAPGWVGPITPIGGLAFLVGWTHLVWLAWRET